MSKEYYRNTLLIFICILGLSLYFSNYAIALFGILALSMLMILMKNFKSFEINAITIIFIVNIIVMLILYFGYINKYGVPYYLGSSDDFVFEQYAKEILKLNILSPKGIQEINEYRFFNGLGYIWILTLVMKVCNFFGGYSTIIPRLINIFFLLYLCILVNKYFNKNELFSRKKSVLVMYIIGLFPNAMYITNHIFRDTLSSFIIFLIFYWWDSFFCINKTKKIFMVIFTIVLAYISYWIRDESIIYIIIIIIISITIKRNRIKISKIVNLLPLIFTFVILIYFFGIQDLLLKYNTHYNQYMTSVSDGLSRIIFMTPLFPFGILIRFIYGLIYPFPGGILNFTKMFSDVDMFFEVFISCGTIIQILFLAYLIKNIRIIDKVTIIFLIMYLSIILTTFGFRHYIMLYPFMAILICRTLFTTQKSKLKLNLILTFFFLTLISSFYILVK